MLSRPCSNSPKTGPEIRFAWSPEDRSGDRGVGKPPSDDRTGLWAAALDIRQRLPGHEGRGGALYGRHRPPREGFPRPGAGFRRLCGDSKTRIRHWKEWFWLYRRATKRSPGIAREGREIRRALHWVARRQRATRTSSQWQNNQLLTASIIGRIFGAPLMRSRFKGIAPSSIRIRFPERASSMSLKSTAKTGLR